MFELPLSEATMSEVLARVSFRWIHYWHRHYREYDFTPMGAIAQAKYALEECELSVLAMWCEAYRRQWTPLRNTHQIREQFILDARRGYSWRRVAHPQYKSNRRADPRVTNRGVRGDSVQENEQ
jgi:hypothetical protein